MKTKQEQIEEMRRTIYNARSKVNGIATAGDIAVALVQAGYGDVPEYKAEIERLKSNNGFLQCVISHSKDMMDEAVKQAQIDVLNKLRRRAWQGYQIGMYIVSTQEIDELIKEVQNGEDKG